MAPIDLIGPEEANWMNEEAEPLRYSERHEGSEIAENVREELYPVVEERLKELDDVSSDYEQKAHEIMDEVSYDEFGSWYGEAASGVNPEEIDSLDFLDLFDEYVAEKAIVKYLD